MSLNGRALNKTTKRRQLLTKLNLQNPDVIFLQEVHSSPPTIKPWEAGRGGTIVERNDSSHSRGIMILFKPKINMSIDKVIRDKNSRYILSDVLLDDFKFIFCE